MLYLKFISKSYIMGKWEIWIVTELNMCSSEENKKKNYFESTYLKEKQLLLLFSTKFDLKKSYIA